MKALIIKTLFLISSVAFCYSQNIEPTQRKLVVYGDSILIISEMETFKQDKFFLGWHWGGANKKLTKALKMNYLHNYIFSDPNDNGTSANQCTEDSKVVIIQKFIRTDQGERIFFNGSSLQYEPSLLIDKDRIGEVQTNLNDPSKPIFGFKYIHPDISNVGRTQYLTLLQNSNYIDSIVLKEPFIDYGMYYRNIKPDNYNTERNYDGSSIYLTINLKRHNLSDTIANSDSILAIKCRYQRRHDGAVIGEGIIRFDSIPDGRPYLYDSIYSSRNEFRGLTKSTVYYRDSVIYITKNMLPSDGSPITLSGHFFCNNDMVFNNAILIDKYYNEKSEKIKNLKVEVVYLGNCDVDIDWIRLETPSAKELAYGVYDDIIVERVQNSFNVICADSFRTKNVEPYRFYIFDEPNISNWYAFRYFNNLIGNIGYAEMNNPIYPQLLRYYTKISNQWYCFAAPYLQVPVPYSRLNHNHSNESFYKSGGVISGYIGYNGFPNRLPFYNVHDYSKSPKECNYETLAVLFNKLYDTLGITYFRDDLDSKMYDYEHFINDQGNYNISSFMVYVEKIVYQYFFRNSSRGFLFDDNGWWAQNNIHIQLDNKKCDTNQAYFLHRPFTGEDIRLFSSLPLLLGAKGIMYDGESTGTDYLKLMMYDNLQLDSSLRYNLENNLSDYEFIHSDEVGPDFIRTDNEIFNINSRFSPLDTLALYLSRPKDKIYISRKTQRTELYKLHSWIRTIDTTLMKLKLAAWQAKGYAKWYQQDPIFTEPNILGKYVNLNQIRTKHPLADNYEGSSIYNYEDSSFYDLTIIRNTEDDPDMQKSFVLGVQNRRTNPLILELDTLQFYTTAEFDHNVQYGGDRVWGTNEPASYWQDKWWKRLGCREITIPIKNLNKPGQHLIVKVKELGIGTSLDNEWWRKDGYTALVDTVLNFTENDVCDKELKVKLLPGEGKLLEINYYFTAKADLKYSNQHKIVQYPTQFDIDGKPLKVKYHATYSRSDGTSPFEVVYYRRSMECSPNLPFQEIPWDFEEPISLDHQLINYPHNNVERELNCSNPSIVIRELDDEPFAFIVYQGAYWADWYGYILEKKFPINRSDYYDLPHELHFLDNIYQDELWGMPVVNASSLGNYYVWTEQQGQGITGAWKTPDSDSFEANHKVLIAYNSQSQLFAHPSVNNYSRLELNEDDCAVVWQEGNYAKTNIMYSRLRIDSNNNLVNYIPQQNIDPNNSEYCTNNLNNVICLSCIYNQSYNFPSGYDPDVPSFESSHEKPFIIRNLLNQQSSNDDDYYRSIHYDNVYWEVHDRLRDITNNLRDTVSLAIRTVFMEDEKNNNVFLPSKVFVSYPFRIYHYTMQLLQPNINQFSTNWNDIQNHNDYCLSFISTPFFEEPSNENSSLWYCLHKQFSLLPYWSPNEFINSSSIDNALTNAKISLIEEIGQTGQFQHLSSIPMTYESDLRRFSARIFQRKHDNYDVFLFSKDTELRNNKYVGFYGYTDLLNNNFLLSNMIIEDNNGIKSLIRTSNYFSDKILQSDTIYSDWFSIGTIDLKYFTMGNQSQLLKLQIQRKLDGKCFSISNQSRGIRRIFRNKQKLINGKNLLYRIVVVKSGIKSFYSEQLHLGTSYDLMDIDDNNYFPKGVEDSYEELINLGEQDETTELLVYPNPANDRLYINLPGVNNGNIRIFSMLGNEMMSLAIENKTTQVLDVSSLVSGSYRIVTEYKDENDEIQTINSTFVISK